MRLLDLAYNQSALKTDYLKTYFCNLHNIFALESTVPCTTTSAIYITTYFYSYLLYFYCYCYVAVEEPSLRKVLLCTCTIRCNKSHSDSERTVSTLEMLLFTYIYGSPVVLRNISHMSVLDHRPQELKEQI